MSEIRKRTTAEKDKEERKEVPAKVCLASLTFLSHRVPMS